MSEAVAPPAIPHRLGAADLTPLLVCALIWGTTWFAITWQLGAVPTLVSVVYRFALAAVVLFGMCLVTRRRLNLTRAQHIAAFGQGLFTFAIDYAFVYFAEERIASAVVAVVFASLAFINLVLFRFATGQRASRGAWGGALLGIAGVAVLSGSELIRANLDAKAWAGLGFAVAAVITAAIGNLFAQRAQKAGAEIFANSAWAMAYGAGLLALAVIVTGQHWAFDWSVKYVCSLLYLAVFGSVAAFVLYFTLARRRGYTFASYISALTPPIAMLVSALFEHAHFGLLAFAGLALVVLGQVMLSRSPKV